MNSTYHFSVVISNDAQVRRERKWRFPMQDPCMNIMSFYFHDEFTPGFQYRHYTGLVHDFTPHYEHERFLPAPYIAEGLAQAGMQ